VVVPSLGESITDGTIATVLKAAGDSVKENETIAQIETDKVTIDIKAPSDGTILGVVVQEQETVVPGQLVATLDDAAAQVSAHSAPWFCLVSQHFLLALLLQKYVYNWLLQKAVTAAERVSGSARKLAMRTLQQVKQRSSCSPAG
jgi:pyruvate/2-oxoglutarate dehydrogenase complex dihydrolipoamide acyltransferase (E2) component